MKTILTILTLLTSLSTYAGEAMVGSQVTPNADFEKMKGLVGKWTGTGKDDQGKEVKVPLTYELVSGGTAIMEKLDAEGHDMVTMYYVDGKTLKMTHYCAVGNQPEMKLAKKDDKSFSFVFEKGTNMANKNTPHMHTLTINWISPNEIEQTWGFSTHAKSAPSTVFKFKRV